MIIRYGIITPEFPPFFGGGIATYCRFLVEGLEKNDVDVDVFVPNWQSNETDIQKIGNHTVHNISVSTWGASAEHLTGHMLASYAIASYLRNLGDFISFEYIEVIDYGAIGYYLLKNRLLSGSYFKNTKIIVSSHGPKVALMKFAGEIEEKLPDYFVGYAELWTMNAADLVIFPTDFARNEIKRLIDLQTRSIVQCYPYVTQNIEIMGLDDSIKKYHSIFFGRKNELKGVKTYTEALENLRNLGDGAFLGGDSWLESENQFATGYLSKEKKRKNLKFTDFGIRETEQIESLLNLGEVIVMPSKIEWYSYAYVECATVGRKTILTEGTGAAELSRKFSDPNSLIIKDDPKALSKAIAQHVNSPCLPFHSKYLLSLDPKANLGQRLTELKKIVPRRSTFYPSVTSTKNQRSIEVNQKVAVVIPYYNSKDTIRDTLHSISNASQFVSQIVIVNDGSRVEDSKYLEDLKKEFSFIVHNQKNCGLASARNAGLKLIEEEYVLFLDSDDLINSEYLRKSIDLLNFYENVGGVGCWIRTFGLRSSLWETFDGALPLNQYKNTLNSAGIVWSRKVLLEVCGFNESILKGFEDWNLVNRVLANGWSIPVIDEPHFLYRVRKNSMFSRLTMDDLLNLYEKHIKLDIQDPRNLAIVENLIKINQPGYSFTYLLQPPLNLEINEVNLFAREIVKRLPFLRIFWDKLPVRVKNGVFIILKIALKFRKTS